MPVSSLAQFQASAAGFSHVLEYALSLGLLGALVWISGYVLISRRARLGGFLNLARWITGLTHWIGALFTLSALHQLHLMPTLVLVAAILGTAGWRAWRERRAGLVTSPAGRAGDPAAPGGLPAGPIALVVILVAPFFLWAIRGFIIWDADVYHLTVPKLYLAHGGFRHLPFNVYSNWPLNVQLLFALAMLWKDYILATLVHFGFGVLTVYAMRVGCREFGSPQAAWPASLLFLASPTVAEAFSCAHVDLGGAFFLTASFLFLMRAREHPNERAVSLLLAGISAGLLAGVKAFLVAGAAVVCVPHLVHCLRGRRDSLRALGAWLVAFAAPAALLWLPWLFKAAWYTGNPVYPFLYEWFGGIEWSATLGEQFSRWHQSTGMGRSWRDFLLLPIRVILEGGPGYAQFCGRVGSFWIVVIPLSLVAGLRRPLERRCLAVAGLYFVFWALSSQQVRFLIPVLPLLSIAGGSALLQLFERLVPAPARRPLGAAALLAGVVAFIALHRDGYRDGLDLVLHSGSRPACVESPPAGSVFEFINRRLPQDAHVLCLNTNRGYYMQRAYLADSFFEASQIVDWLRDAHAVPVARSLLTQRAITHVLVDSYNWGLVYPAGLRELLTPRHARRVFADGGCELFELLPPTEAAPASQVAPGADN